jgi:hypothetical protein
LQPKSDPIRRRSPVIDLVARDVTHAMQASQQHEARSFELRAACGQLDVKPSADAYAVLASALEGFSLTRNR